MISAKNSRNIIKNITNELVSKKMTNVDKTELKNTIKSVIDTHNSKYKVTRTPNLFFAFMKQNRATIKTKLENDLGRKLTGKEICTLVAKEGGKQWRSMTDDEKKIFKQNIHANEHNTNIKIIVKPSYNRRSSAPAILTSDTIDVISHLLSNKNKCYKSTKGDIYSITTQKKIGTWNEQTNELIPM